MWRVDHISLFVALFSWEEPDNWPPALEQYCSRYHDSKQKHRRRQAAVTKILTRRCGTRERIPRHAVPSPVCRPRRRLSEVQLLSAALKSHPYMPIIRYNEVYGKSY